MQYIEFKNKLAKYVVFDQKQILLYFPDFQINRLADWQKKGYIRKIIKGHYIFADLELNENYLAHIANKIYSPSYISLETALRFYNLLPETVYGLTSITSRQTRLFNTELGRFTYRNVKKNLFFGYQNYKFNSFVFSIADIEKAILDYLYFSPYLKTESDFVGLRIDGKVFTEQCDENKLMLYLEQFQSKALEKRLKKLQGVINSA